MKILREYLGGKEEIDLSTKEGWHTWYADVVQDWQVAEEMAASIEALDEYTVNEDQPEYVERYTKLSDGPWRRDPDTEELIK